MQVGLAIFEFCHESIVLFVGGSRCLLPLSASCVAWWRPFAAVRIDTIQCFTTMREELARRAQEALEVRQIFADFDDLEELMAMSSWNRERRIQHMAALRETYGSDSE